MRFLELAQSLEKLELTTKRLEITHILAEVLNQLTPAEVGRAAYLMQGRLVPFYQALEFGLSSKMIIRVLGRLASGGEDQVDLFGSVTSKGQEDQVLQQFKKLGDLGLVAEQVVQSKTQKLQPVGLGVIEVYQKLYEVAEAGGTGSQEVKISLLTELLGSLEPVSAKFVVRIILGKLRLGFSDMTIIDALSWAKVGDKSEREWLELAYSQRADIGALAADYLSWAELNPVERQEKLKEYHVKVGVPMLPALCQRLNSAQEIIEKMGMVLAEPKYDGMRVQIHFSRTSRGHEFHVFTRGLEEVTHMFPELESIVQYLNCESCLLDGEAIGYDRESGRLLPFQETITRRRKHSIAAAADLIPLRFYIFDIMSLNNLDVTQQKLQERKDLLEKTISKNEHILPTPYIVTEDPKELHSFHDHQLAEGLEGAVIKQQDSPYQSGRKGWQWVKIKEAEGTTGKLADTLDCVVMGYYVGRGKRTEFGLGAFLVGVLETPSNSPTAEPTAILSISKIGTGLSDVQLAEMRQRCDDLVTTEQPEIYQVPKGLIPDGWVKPGLVVEIAADELTKSPSHTAGVALRFPRLVRVREDKTWLQATTLNEVNDLIKLQRPD